MCSFICLSGAGSNVHRPRFYERFKLLRECVAIDQAAPTLLNLQIGEPIFGIARALANCDAVMDTMSDRPSMANMVVTVLRVTGRSTPRPAWSHANGARTST
jgi:hypothetical protein